MMHSKGPDELLPADRIWTWNRDEPVKIRLAESGPAAEKPISIPSMFENTVKKHPNALAMAVKRDGEWKKWTYKQYYDDVIIAAKALIALGVETYHGVGVVGFNSPEWFIANNAAIFCGGFATGIYTTNSPEACQYVADSCEANVIFVENEGQLKKILQVWDQLPHLKAVVQWSGKFEKKENVYSWTEFMQMGKESTDVELKQRIAQLAPNKCCTLIYTSGTTGNPKGVMLSHDNITFTARAAGKAAQLGMAEDRLISYLPLSHIAAQIMDVYASINFAVAIYFAQPDALKGSLGKTMAEVRPTAFLGVPRVWEKMQEKMIEVGRSRGAVSRKVAAWAKDIGLRGNLSRMEGGSVPFGWGLASRIFKKVRYTLGLDQCKLCASAAAPITRETLEFFLSLDINVNEIYGMSECTGPHTMSFPWKYRLGTVGQEVPGFFTKLDNPDQDGNGEICMAGRHVFMGYLNEEAKTRETFDDDGYLHSGDIGKRDDKGFLSITGRIKELLITAGGENVAPVPIEDTVKSELPIVSNCMLIGDKKKFLSMLITLKTKVDEDTMQPKDELSHAAIEWCKNIGCNATTVSELLSSPDEKFLKAIQDGIDRANAKSVSRAQKIQKWSMLPRDFSIPGGELGPTLKLRRPIVTKMYEKTIGKLYDE